METLPKKSDLSYVLDTLDLIHAEHEKNHKSGANIIYFNITFWYYKTIQNFNIKHDKNWLNFN